MFLYNYHLTMFLLYNQRRFKKDWRNKTEEEIVKQRELHHAFKAAALMPDGLISQAFAQQRAKDCN